MAAGESSVLVRLRLLGSQAFAAAAKRDAVALREMGVAGEATAAKMKMVGGAMTTASASAAAAARMIRRAALPLAVLGAASGKLAMDFQQSMLLIHTQAGASMDEVDRLSKSVLNLAKIEPQSPNDLAQALYRLEGAGLRGAKAMTGLKAAADLAAVGNANVEDTAKTLSQVWFSGIKGASNLKKVVAEMNATVGAGDMRLQQLVDALGTGIMPVAKNAGLRMRDITGALAVFGDETNNVSGWTAQLATALHYLYAPTTKGANAMDSIGLSGKKLGQDFRKKNGLLTALKDLRGHLDKLPGGFRGLKAAQTLSEILPGGRGRVLNVMLGQIDRYEAKIKQIGGTTNRFGEAVAKTHQTAAFKIKAAWSTIQVALIHLGGHILPLASAAFVGVASAVDKLSSAMGKLAHNKTASSILAGFRAGKAGKSGPETAGFTGASGTAVKVGRAVSPQARAGFKAGISGKSSAETAGFTGIGATAVKVGRTIRNVATGAVKYGKQFLLAFKPAQPFFENVLLPLLKGVAKGVIGAVIAAVPAIKFMATALGFVGKMAKPLKPVFEGIGLVLGFLFAGPILKLLGGLGKIGVVFKALRVPVVIMTEGFGLFGKAAGLVWKALGGVTRGFMRGFTAVQRFAGTFTSLPGRMVRSALNIVGGVIHVIETLPGRLVSLATRAGKGLAESIPKGVRSGLGALGSFFGRVGKSIIRWMVNAIKSAPKEIKDAVMSILPGPIRGAASKALGLASKIGLATGGTVTRGGTAIVGERGPELLQLPTGSTVYDSATTRRAGRRMAAQPPIYLTANLHLSGKQIHSEVFRVERQTAEVT